MTPNTDADPAIKEFETQISIREQAIAGDRKIIEASERMNREKLGSIARSETIIAALRRAIDDRQAALNDPS